MKMENQSTDRQIQRTRLQVITALLELLEHTTYDQLTIQQVCEQANIGRSTFYAHFQGKDDLLRFGFHHALNLLVAELHIDPDTHFIEWNALPFLQHTRGHFQLYRTLLLGTGYAALTQQGVKDLADKIAEKMAGLCSIPVEIAAYTTASAALSLVKFWLDRRMPEDVEQVNHYFQSLIVATLQNQVAGA
jgi:AcrR family transcriptional regulator